MEPISFRDPYSSPRVLRALIDDLLDQVCSLIYRHALEQDQLMVQAYLQANLDSALSHIRYGGMSLSYYMTVSLLRNPETKAFEIVFKPRGEDGLFLLNKLQITKSQYEYEPPPQVQKAAKVEVRRVVEL